MSDETKKIPAADVLEVVRAVGLDKPISPSPSQDGGGGSSGPPPAGPDAAAKFIVSLVDTTILLVVRIAASRWRVEITPELSAACRLQDDERELLLQTAPYIQPYLAQALAHSDKIGAGIFLIAAASMLSSRIALVRSRAPAPQKAPPSPASSVPTGGPGVRVGVSLYIGAPGQGKTALAIERASADGAPALYVNSGAVTLRDRKGKALGCPTRTTDPVRALAELYGDPPGPVEWVPQYAAHFHSVLDALDALQKKRRAARVLLVDEVSIWPDARQAVGVFAELVRLHRHRKLSVHLTTQAPQDIAARLRNCATDVFAFRSTDERALKVLSQWFPPEKISNLERFSFLHWSIGSQPMRESAETQAESE